MHRNYSMSMPASVLIVSWVKYVRRVSLKDPAPKMSGAHGGSL
jgi:hypothetical protein